MKIYVLSLVRDEARREGMRRQFESLGSAFHSRYEWSFFDATDARAGEHLSFRQYSKLRALLFRGKELSAGERGCFASHYRLWEECVREDKPIVVLEDDVVLGEQFVSELARVERSSFAYVRLMYSKSKSLLLVLPDDFYLSFENLAGTQGYYLTPRAARAFIEGARVWYRPVDDYMDMFYKHGVPNVCVKPVLRELMVESTIDDRGKKPMPLLKISREILRCVNQMRAWMFLRWRADRLLLPQETKDFLQSIKHKKIKKQECKNDNSDSKQNSWGGYILCSNAKNH